MNAKKESRELKSLALQHRGEGGYPQWFRDRASSYAMRRRRKGATWAEISREVGVSGTALSNWLRACSPSPGSAEEEQTCLQGLQGSDSPPPDLVPVVLEEPEGTSSEASKTCTCAPSRATLTLVTPKGYRVEGLVLSQVLQLLEVC